LRGKDIILIYDVYRRFFRGRKFMNEIKDEVGRFLLDLAKLAFASLVLGTVVRGNIDDYVIIIGGIIGSFICLVVGLLLIYYSRREK
jgi:hypothetical protein